jgi:hypothetical protein
MALLSVFLPRAKGVQKQKQQKKSSKRLQNNREKKVS